MAQSPETQDGPRGRPLIGIVGDHNPDLLVHRATEEALTHVSDPVPFEWIPTDAIRPDAARLRRYSGLLISPASPYRSMEGALTAIRHARERGVPLLGTCGGFQHVVVEFVRDVLGISDAEHEETSPGAAHLAVTALSCSLAGQDHRVQLRRGTRVSGVYGMEESVEPFFCRYGLNPEYRPGLEARGFSVSAVDEHGEPRVLELAGHPFYFVTLYVPQVRSRVGSPHPLVEAFVAAARQRSPMDDVAES